jgi:hypothetical protein
VTGSYGGKSATASLTVQSVSTTYTLSGLVRDNKLRAIAGARVVASQAGFTQTATTNASGQYQMSLPAGTYKVYCLKDGMKCTVGGSTSATITLGPSTPTATVNFTAKNTTTYTIQGTIALSTGGGASGVVVNITWGGLVAQVTTNSSGAYSLTGLLGATYVVTPSDARYNFTPTSRSMRISRSSVTANFTATPK